MRCQEREFDCILCVPPRQGCKKGTGGYNQISFIAKTTVNFRKRTLFPKPAVMIIPSLYSQVRSKQLQLKWHTGNSRLSLLLAPVQADNRAWLCSLPQVLNSLFCIQITQGCFSTEPLILWLEQALLLCCWHVTSGTACVLKPWGFLMPWKMGGSSTHHRGSSRINLMQIFLPAQTLALYRKSCLSKSFQLQLLFEVKIGVRDAH